MFCLLIIPVELVLFGRLPMNLAKVNRGDVARILLIGGKVEANGKCQMLC